MFAVRFGALPVAGAVGLATAAVGSVLMYKRWREAGEGAPTPLSALGGAAASAS